MIKLDVPRFEQTKMMCSPYSFKQVFSYYNDEVDINELKKESQSRIDAGTWFSLPVLFAKKRGYRVDVYSNYLGVFDPTWSKLSKKEMAKKLMQRYQFKKKEKGQYIGLVEFLKKGGNLYLKPITKEVIKNI